MDSVDLSPQAHSMCLRNIDPIGLGPRDHPRCQSKYLDLAGSYQFLAQLTVRKNTARHGRPLTIPARHQGLGARHGDIIGLGRRHQLHICILILSTNDHFISAQSGSLHTVVYIQHNKQQQQSRGNKEEKKLGGVEVLLGARRTRTQ